MAAKLITNLLARSKTSSTADSPQARVARQCGRKRVRPWRHAGVEYIEVCACYGIIDSPYFRAPGHRGRPSARFSPTAFCFLLRLAGEKPALEPGRGLLPKDGLKNFALAVKRGPASRDLQLSDLTGTSPANFSRKWGLGTGWTIRPSARPFCWDKKQAPGSVALLATSPWTLQGAAKLGKRKPPPRLGTPHPGPGGFAYFPPSLF